MKKIISVLLVLSMVLVLGASALASSEEPNEPADRPEPLVVEGETYITDHVIGASAVYVSGESKVFDDTYFYGAGYADDDQIVGQIPNQYGMCAVVLACGQGTEVTLNDPTIVSDPQSYSNGVFAAAMAKVTINGGTIDTDNSSGHGIDTTYMGHVYAYDTVIHTRGMTSGGLASDFGGGFIQGERLDVTTDGMASPGIFCAGTTIIMLKDSKLTANGGTGVVVAHDHAVTVLEDCEVNAKSAVISGLQALPSPEQSDGSRAFIFGGTLTSESGEIVSESGGRTEVNLVGVECHPGGDAVISASKGILTVNVWDTELTGNVTCADGATLVINLYDGAKLTGEVTGNVELNVYAGGEYAGSYAVNAVETTGEPAPVPGGFDDYLISDWGTGSLTWKESRAQEYVTEVEPLILENSAACYVKEGASSVTYDPETYDPSENGVDLSLLDVNGAHGFTLDEVFGGAESRTFSGSGEASGESSAS